MKPASFDYVRATTLEEAVGVLAADDGATVIAGGQSLLPMLNLRVTAAETLLDITRLEELKAVRETGEQVFIGALVTHASIEDGIAREAFGGLLQRVASKIAYRAVRNLGTVGGSVVLSDPSADWPACLLALDATAVLASASGERRVALSEFLVDAYETALKPGEILTGFEILRRNAGGWGVGKVARKSGAFADSLAVAVLGRAGQATRIALSGTASCAQPMARVAALLDEEPGAPAEQLARAIRADITDAHEEATPYQERCHLHTVMSAITEARQSWS
ncbi:FAD binding domain-containing protein [Nitratireductor indicus]|uniref:FAD binding domain-containing protein n=1 Tax=Nitratireductor indicus TaxID=721133 RepID=UPI0028746FB1|nr:FAD binding domain-containing protein [Nitratireductor indicus]MDS1136409.1 FAD binding domain-containing protein [Nitratireductor indicus]